MYIDICIWCAKYNEYGENMVSSVGEIGTKDRSPDLKSPEVDTSVNCFTCFRSDLQCMHTHNNAF